jgi:uncharacterized protein (TIGR02265 family)
VFDQLLTTETELEGPLDVDPIADAIPASFKVKGMFCKRFVEVLGAEFTAMLPRLETPPRGGNYVAFKDYSQRDYCRLAAAAAHKRFPSVSRREAVRLMSRDDLKMFSDSMLGRVVLTIAGDAHSTIHRLPEIYARVAPGMTLRCTDLDQRTTRVLVEGHVGMIEYTLGQIEGIVLAFGGKPTSIVRELSQRVLAFDVTHESGARRQSWRAR